LHLPEPEEGTTMTRLLPVLLAAVLLPGGSGFAAPERVTIDAKNLVGKWEPKDQKPGAVPTSMEFTKDGKAHVVGDVGGAAIDLDGTYALAGDRLTVTLRFGDNDTPTVYTVLSLGTGELRMKDAKGVVQALRRVKAGK
jgi:uncharacterized protein (TIGR03066 family)